MMDDDGWALPGRAFVTVSSKEKTNARAETRNITRRCPSLITERPQHASTGSDDAKAQHMAGFSRRLYCPNTPESFGVLLRFARTAVRHPSNAWRGLAGFAP